VPLRAACSYFALLPVVRCDSVLSAGTWVVLPVTDAFTVARFWITLFHLRCSLMRLRCCVGCRICCTGMPLERVRGPSFRAPFTVPILVTGWWVHYALYRTVPGFGYGGCPAATPVGADYRTGCVLAR